MAIISLIWGDLALSKSWCNICHLDTTTTTLVLLTHILSHLDRANVGWGPSARSDGSGHSPTVPGCGDDEPRISRLAQREHDHERVTGKRTCMASSNLLRRKDVRGARTGAPPERVSQLACFLCSGSKKFYSHTIRITECPFNL
jgi:hypothetical protein